jgi:dolichyl-phosphate beta-glucosyltransferase
MAKQHDLSIIIPTYREEVNITRCIIESLEFFRKNPRIRKFEIIFVADNAGDRTISIIRRHLPANPELRLLVNKNRLQKGFSVRRGVLGAKYSTIMFYDADLSTPLYETNKFLDHIDGYDLVIASRGLKGSKVKKKWTKMFFSRGFSFLKKTLLGIDFTDTQCGFKMFTRRCRELFEKQTISSSTFDLEILYLAKKKGFSVKELPVTWIDSDASNFTTLGNVKQCLRDMFHIINTQRKGKYG